MSVIIPFKPITHQLPGPDHFYHILLWLALIDQGVIRPNMQGSSLLDHQINLNRASNPMCAQIDIWSETVVGMDHDDKEMTF